MKKNLLITGGTGLLGLNWYLAAKENFNVILHGHVRKIKFGEADIQYFSLESPSEIERYLTDLEISIVVNAAGMTNVDLCEKNPELARYINVELADNMAKVCNKLKIKLIHISTDHLYPGNESCIDEFHQPKPINVYGRTKAEAEPRVQESCPESLVIRTNFYGWGTSYRKSFSDMVFYSLKEMKEITLFDDVFYTPILVEVLSDTVHQLINAGEIGIFNVVGDERISKYDFGIKLAKEFNLNLSLIKKGNISEHKDLVKRPSDMSLSNMKVTELLKNKIGNTEMHLKILHKQYREGIQQELLQL